MRTSFSVLGFVIGLIAGWAQSRLALALFPLSLAVVGAGAVGVIGRTELWEKALTARVVLLCTLFAVAGLVVGVLFSGRLPPPPAG